MLVPTRIHRYLVQDPIEAASRDLGQLVDRLFTIGDGRESAVFPADVRDDVDHIYVEAELPGFRKDEVDITLEKNVLAISAERKVETTQSSSQSAPQPAEGNPSAAPEAKQHAWLLRERQAASFHRSFRLPPTVSEAAVEARYEDGVLYVTLNKREESKPRKIAIG